MGREKPRSAWRSERWRTIERSLPSRLKTRCVAVSSCSTTSPGTMPGVCSLARSNVIVAPRAMPRSTTASSVVGSSLHCSSEGTCTSWLKIMFPMRFCTVLRSAGQLGPQPSHLGDPRFVRQPRHTTRLRTCALMVRPLYRSSRVTRIFELTSLPFCTPIGRPHGSRLGSSSTAFIPPASYLARLSPSLSTSYACVIFLNVSVEPPLSASRREGRVRAGWDLLSVQGCNPPG